MASRKNGDIRGFFKSAGPSNSQTHSQPASSQSSPPSSRYPLLDLPSSPRTPSKAKATPRVFKPDEEIKGSDESDDESDDSLGSITGALGFRTGPAAHRRDPDVLATPQAKRIASSSIHRSPLTLQPKKHKFDLKALMSHSRELQRTEESIMKADALITQTEQNSDESDNSGAENDPKRLEEAARHLLVSADDNDGKGDKLRNAFKRSKNDETSSRKHCYFFDEEEPPSRSSKRPFPRKKATGRWKCLSQADARRHAFAAGLPRGFIMRGEALPDELFQWILDEIRTEQSIEMRRQYVQVVGLCKDSTNRLVDDERLYGLLEGIGGPKYTHEHNKLESTTEIRYGYLERDWSRLITLFDLLSQMAPNLQTATTISAIQLLLRMSMDPIIAIVMRDHYTHAITALVSALARDRSSWNKACEAVCSYIYENVDDLELRVTCLLSIPSATSHLVDIRRRIAAESLFDEPGLGRKRLDSRLSFAKIRNRLDEDDFKSTNKIDFDYERLRAVTTLLDIVIDRADFMQPKATKKKSDDSRNTAAATITSTTTTTLDGAAEREFNADIDALAARVKAVHDRIRDKASRKNVKLALLGLEKRLQYAVRTRPPPRTDIFALDNARKPDADEPRQRDFMRQWALKKKKAEKELGQEEEEEDKDEAVLDKITTKTAKITATMTTTTTTAASAGITSGRRRGTAGKIEVAVG